MCRGSQPGLENCSVSAGKSGQKNDRAMSSIRCPRSLSVPALAADGQGSTTARPITATSKTPITMSRVSIDAILAPYGDADDGKRMWKLAEARAFDNAGQELPPPFGPHPMGLALFEAERCSSAWPSTYSPAAVTHGDRLSQEPLEEARKIDATDLGRARLAPVRRAQLEPSLGWNS